MRNTNKQQDMMLRRRPTSQAPRISADAVGGLHGPDEAESSPYAGYELTFERAWFLRLVQLVRATLFFYVAIPLSVAFWFLLAPLLLPFALAYFCATLIKPALVEPNNPAELRDFRVATNWVSIVGWFLVGINWLTT